jgi:hypothetical protein
LDVAIKLGIPHGGWTPKGRLTEKGPFPERYLLQEMPTNSYLKRASKIILISIQLFDPNSFLRISNLNL